MDAFFKFANLEIALESSLSISSFICIFVTKIPFPIFCEFTIDLNENSFANFTAVLRLCPLARYAANDAEKLHPPP